MDTAACKKSLSAQETSKVASSSTPNLASLQNDELIGLYTTGSFYDCSFKVSNDVTGDSKVVEILLPGYLSFFTIYFALLNFLTIWKRYDILSFFHNDVFFSLIFLQLHGQAVSFREYFPYFHLHEICSFLF